MNWTEIEKEFDDKFSYIQGDWEGWEVNLAPKGSQLAIFQKERTDALSEMFENKYANGIYPTSKFYARLDDCVSKIISSEKRIILKELCREIESMIDPNSDHQRNIGYSNAASIIENKLNEHANS